MSNRTVVIVEYYSNEFTEIGSDGCRQRQTGLAHISSTFNGALYWCASNKDYNGKEDNWHWRLTTVDIDGDWAEQSCESYSHYNRDVKLCSPDGKPLDFADVDYEEAWDDDDYEAADFREVWDDEVVEWDDSGEEDDFTSHTSTDKQDQIIALLKAIKDKL